MRRLLRSLLLRPVLWATYKFSSRPKKALIFKALDKLYSSIREKPDDRGPVLTFERDSGKFIIFSDQHKGAKNGSDDFILSEPNYLAALDHYFQDGFTLVSLGDSEELWENSLSRVKKHNEPSFECERKFLRTQRFIKVFGNHDLFLG